MGPIEEMRGDVVSIDFFVTVGDRRRSRLVESTLRTDRHGPEQHDPLPRAVNFCGEGVQYVGILDRFNDHPDRVKFPVSRNR